MRIRNRPLIAVPALFMLAGCAIPGPTTSRAERERIEAFVYDAPLDIGPTRVRAFRGGSPDLPRVIYVHGTPGEGLNWANFLVDPVPGTESVAIDRPGHGASEPLGAVTDITDQAAALQPLLVRREGRGAILVGHSFGAPVVAEAALQQPNRVDGLVLVAGSMDPALERTLLVQKIGASPIVQPLLPRWVRNLNLELIALESQLRELADRLRAVDVPVEVIHGTRDNQVPYSNVEFIRAAMSDDPNVTTIENGNHFVPWKNEALIRDAIARLLEIEPPARESLMADPPEFMQTETQTETQDEQTDPDGTPDEESGTPAGERGEPDGGTPERPDGADASMARSRTPSQRTAQRVAR